MVYIACRRRSFFRARNNLNGDRLRRELVAQMIKPNPRMEIQKFLRLVHLEQMAPDDAAAALETLVNHCIDYVKPQMHNLADETDKMVHRYWLGNNQAIDEMESKQKALWDER